MKTLSTKQPWAYLICSGIKDIENRSWKTNYRGKVLIHTSALRAHWQLTAEQFFNTPNNLYKELKNTCTSAIIGSVDIIDCIQDHQSVWAEKGQYHWVLKNPILFKEPILDIKGKLGLWEYDKPLNICHVCSNITDPDWICEDCGASYNQFTQIDYNCCKKCEESFKTRD